MRGGMIHVMIKTQKDGQKKIKSVDLDQYNYTVVKVYHIIPIKALMFLSTLLTGHRGSFFFIFASVIGLATVPL